MYKDINILKKKIQVINPQITDDVLDLLFEYITFRLCDKETKSISNSKSLKIYASQIDIKGTIVA